MVEFCQLTSHIIGSFLTSIPTTSRWRVNIVAIYDNCIIHHIHMFTGILIHAFNIFRYSGRGLWMVIRGQHLCKSLTIRFISISITHYRHRTSSTANVVLRVRQDIKSQIIGIFLLTHSKHLVVNVIACDIP